MLRIVTICLLLISQNVSADTFDHSRLDRLLQQHVVMQGQGEASAVDYAALAAKPGDLESYLQALSAVDKSEFEQWAESEQLAFLINAYNAFTLQLILTKYPDLDSIKDLGSLFRSPWKKAFVPLLGEQRSLDDIEHGLIRGSGRYAEPRIHFAVNCASIGCPALLNRAYQGDQLEQQLERQTRAFLSDRSRNRIEGGELQLSPIFKWYREDFEQGWRGSDNLSQFLLRYADPLGLNAAQRQQLQQQDLEIDFTDYNWLLNDVRS
ncbi:DUF547 domain-containing protein [Marinobacterium jannaschii]|uniref:DUF547 domain-containing protein n=1 Tax=Marinobacterium jannaschii TaxID=64970 RepID=UPI000488F2B1|nr:DUF547 domain-containing protein [Marinobacterium jannaschii]